MTVKTLLQDVRCFGEDTIRYISHAGFYTENDVYRTARLAFRRGAQYLERMRVAQAPMTAVLSNRAAFAQRLAQTPRCKYRKATEHPVRFKGVDTGLTHHSIGDPCGGKLVVKKLRRKVVDVQCRTCGRSAMPKPTEVAQQQEAA